MPLSIMLLLSGSYDCNLLSGLGHVCLVFKNPITFDIRQNYFRLVVVNSIPSHQEAASLPHLYLCK